MSIQDSVPAQPDRAVAQASPHDVIGVGLAFSAAGLYFMLGAAGYAPLPESNSPAFIAFCAGAAFLFAGLTCIVRARAGILNIESDIPDSAPRWAQVSYRMLAIGAAGALAIIGTYVAIGSGPHAFSLSTPLAEMQTTGEAVGRTVFGLGAVIVWIYVIALTVGTVRKLFDRRGG
jgi:hypothetical protein